MSNNIQIFVKVPNKTITITIENGYDMSVAELKKQIYEKEGIPETASFLTYCSRVLDSNRYLSDYNIQNESTIHLNIRSVEYNQPEDCPKLKRQITDYKYDIPYKIAKETNRPCTAQIDFDKQRYYIILPNNKKISGNISQVCNELEEYSYTWNDVISLDEARSMVFDV